MTRMNEVLTDQEFLVGPLTLADSIVAGSVLTLKKKGNIPAGLSNVDAWLSRVEEQIPANLRSAYMDLVN